MEPINLKVLPFVAIILVCSFLAFSFSIGLNENIEVMLDLGQVLTFLAWLSAYISLTSIFLTLTLSQVKDIYLRIGLFFILLLPYASVFILRFAIDPIFMLFIFVLFIGMCFTILTDFNRLYSNQIKTDIVMPSRATAKTITFFVALVTAIVFFNVNNNATSEQALSDKILDKLNSSIMIAIEDYDLVEKMSGQMGMDALTQTQLGQNALDKMEPQINTYIADQVAAMLTPYMPYIVFILTALIFGTIAGASTFVWIFTTLLSLLILYLLKSLGYMKEIKQTVEVTRITL